LNHTKAPAVLIEVCFVDDPDDVKLYKKTYKKIAKVIADSIGG
jgi:N-acetylmuramoyl-L-alanine amidase